MITLAIETSCDETSVAVLDDGRKILSNIISSQIELHREYGGVVPELASRKHIENINIVIEEALEEANIDFNDIDLIGVTQGPGLVGALLIGISTAKALAYSLDVPLIGVNHMIGHICANYIQYPDLKPPFVGLIVSGGHTYLLHVKDYLDYEVIGRTRDDAAGEAFDKVARSLGLKYPGGPEIDKMAKLGDKTACDFPRVMLEKDTYDFSFSGLKTAVLNYQNTMKQKGEEISIEDVSASFQSAVVDVLVEKAFRLVKELNMDKLVMAGGVASNSSLREEMEKRGEKEGVKIYYPSPILSTDNAAMIASAAYYTYKAKGESDLGLKVMPQMGMELG